MGYLIYCATNSMNGKVYIGKNKGTKLTRHWSHKREALILGSPWPFHRAIRKYQWESFSWDIVARCDSEQEANELERYYIALTVGYHYNLTKGGEGNSGYKHSDASRAFTSQRMMGNRNHRFGISPSEETKRKRSVALKGQRRSLEVCHLFSQQKKGAKNPQAKAIVDQNGTVYVTITEAANQTKVSRFAIRRALIDGSSRLGYTFKEVEVL